jgi:protein-L-isoaspartate(D-aspartate) O-methyltransferase
MADITGKAFSATPRENFLPDDMKKSAHLDAPLPIGYGQTNSQPSTVRMMLEWLDAKPGQRVLDVGYGSGWTTALLSRIVGEKGRVVAVERVPRLVKIGEQNCKNIGIANAEFHQAGDKFGWQKQAPYERILVSASAGNLPDELVAQLADGGRMVIPVRTSVLVVNKDKKGRITKDEHPGFAFVPLVE